MNRSIIRMLGGVSFALAAAMPAQAASFLVSPLSFDFGDVAVGASGIQQQVTITNVTSATEALNLAGGGAGVFGGTTSCGSSLSAGASCAIYYDFSPTSLGAQTGSTSLSVNGTNYSFAFKGSGLVPFLVSPSVMNFGNVAVGTTSSQQAVTITNVSKASQALNLAGGGAGQFGGTTDCFNSLTAGGSCHIYYAFSPTGGGAATGSTSLSIGSTNYSFSFSGSGGADDGSPFLVSARAFDFGNVPLGEASPQQAVTITNVSGSTQTLNLAGGGAGLFGGVTSCGVSLDPGASCAVDYSFTPTALGDATGTTTLEINGKDYSFSFEGAGIKPFLLSALSFDFGDVAVGTSSAEQRVQLYNVSDVTQTFSLAGGGAGLFGGVTDCGGPLAAGAACNIFYSFTPTANGAVSGSTSLDVDGIPTEFDFTGVGFGGADTTGGGGSAVPELGTWAMMIVGLGCAGRMARRRSHSGAAPAGAPI